MEMNNERCEAVKEYCNNNLYPKDELCPRVVQYWTTSKGKMYWDSLTGLRTEICPINSRETWAVRPYYYGTYVEYIPELKALEISGISLKGNRGEDGKKKFWEYGMERSINPRYFIFNDTLACYDEWGREYLTGKKYVNEVIIEHLSYLQSTMCRDTCGKEIAKFTGKEFDMNEGWYSWRVAQWYGKSFKQRTATKKAFLLDYELESETIPDTVITHTACTFTKLSEEYGVIRIYEDNNYYNRVGRNYANMPTTPDFSNELGRVYINNKGKVNTATSWRGVWNLNTTHWLFGCETTLVDYEKFLEWKPLKYILPIMDAKEMSIKNILSILRHPIIEQLAKAGYPNIAKHIMGESVPSDLKTFFGVEKEKKLPLYKLLGVNKEILKTVENKMSEDAWKYKHFIHDVKSLYGKFDISDLSKETIDTLMSIYKVYDFYGIVSGSTYSRYGDNQRYEYTDEDRRIINRLAKLEQKCEGIVELYKDTVQTYNRISYANRPELDIVRFDNYNDLMRMHDLLVDIKAREDAERQARYDETQRERIERLKKTFEKLQEDRIKKYEYEDDEFCIRVPKELNEITQEGISLHHCVGGYVDRHAEGNTNILFLRRKEDETKSFYTIEIRNGDVIQIHGNHNRWLGNNPEAVPFVYNYLMQLGVRFSRDMLLNKGTGYGKGAESLPESALLYASKVAVA